MPGGLSDPVMGYAAFCAVKLAGYTGFCAVLNRKFPHRSNALAAGASRTGIGMAFGSLNLITPFYFPPFLFVLPLLRIFEWWLLLKWFYPEVSGVRNTWQPIGWGLLISFVLDVPAAIGYFAIGGFWVC